MDVDISPNLSVLYTDLQQRRDLHDGNYVLDAGTHSITMDFAVLIHSIVRGIFFWYVK
jgi:hypothetical protein